jgi:cathepsin B
MSRRTTISLNFVVAVALVIVLVALWVLRRALTTPPRLRDVPLLLDHVPDKVFEHHFVMTLGRALTPDQVLPRYYKMKEALLVSVRSQGTCASCWAFAVSDSMADRVSMHTRGQVKQTLSAQELLGCFRPHTFTCDVGGLPEAAFEYVITRGLLTEDAYPYANLLGGRIEKCRLENTFSMWESFNRDDQRHERKKERVFAQAGSMKNLCYPPLTKRLIDVNIQNMKTEIFLNGPIVGTIMVYSDLYAYDGESVYEVSPDAKFIGGHAIEIFGWSDEGQNTEERGFEGAYWICRTSWGDLWPRDVLKKHASIFYVRMGANVAGIESRASCAEPLLTVDMKEKEASQPQSSTAYASYTEYVSDPERENFFEHLQTRARRVQN